MLNERPAILRLAVKPLLARPVPRSGSNRRADRYDWLYGAMVVLAAVVRMPLLELPGFAADIAYFKRWGLFAVEHGLFRVYELPTVNHPPLSALLWWCVAQLARLINPAFGPQDAGLAAALDSVAYTALVKGAACIADLLIGVLVYRWARQTAGPRWGVAAAAAILLHPAMIYVSAWWGQIDSILALGLLVAFTSAGVGQARRSAVLYALIVLVKAQALILLPVFALLQWQRSGLRQVLHSGEVLASVLVLAALPFLLADPGGHIFRSSGQAGGLQGIGSFGTRALPTNNAYNIWWLALDPEQRRQSDLQPLWGSLTSQSRTTPGTIRAALAGHLPRRVIGLAGFGVVYALALVWLWQRGPREWPVAAIAVYASFFMLPTQIHERYLLPFFPLMVIAVTYHRRLLPWFVGWSLTFTANLLHVGGLGGLGGLPCGECIGSALRILTPDRIAGINLALWITLLIVLWWLPSARPGQRSAPRPPDEPAAASP